eukprot:CAMPEP_0172566282 /NCGR_PEP_ID=MMETSP1067-20121228/111285_1 /TAXON_ID=265564 ORGANISM="Thalassiosira punctigera, Strain Tpunct2005C2" /NCGR_SAMPLE_ID=MMETSP1067 /ASSEMBLY_ACC=CAM_ASM_000444 /LENGTH=360 /DNA_ID=CAMNT_0013357353 /DNA_START=33 /DNA_END=1111 /DNA_ORIENTATION=-
MQTYANDSASILGFCHAMMRYSAPSDPSLSPHAVTRAMSIGRRRDNRRFRAASLLDHPASPVSQLILLAFLSCIAYMLHMHNLVTKSFLHCASGEDSVGVQVLMPNHPVISKNISSSHRTTPSSSCQAEYDRVTAGQTPGLTNQDLRRSQAWIGNQYRLVRTMEVLSSRRRPVVAVVAGGSISLGHGVRQNSARYAERLEGWMNEMYPLQRDERTSDDNRSGHRVINVSAHGADMCAMAKRLNMLYAELSSEMPPSSDGAPDLIILEFAVNDYQGQDHLITVDSKTSVFFEGFRELVLCAEVVIHALLNQYSNAAIMFLEMQTAIATRKTGALLHQGVAQQYQIPIVSYAEALFPDFWRL